MHGEPFQLKEKLAYIYLFINNLTKEEYIKILSDNLKDLRKIGGKLFVSMR